MAGLMGLELWLPDGTIFGVIAIMALVLYINPRLFARASLVPKDDPYEDIQPLQGFDWSKEEPIRLRPFKLKYHLTMAIETTTLSDLVAIDKTYLERIALRRQIVERSSFDTLASLPGSEDAIDELYIWLFSVYLPRRFPTMFTLIAPGVSDERKGRDLYLRNRVTNESIPTTPPAEPISALRMISSHLDNDFLILLPRLVPSSGSPATPDPLSGERYHLLAFANCFPSGFRPRDKLGHPLNVIHKPVPEYATRLERSMDKYFATLPVGKIVKRANWTISENPEIFVLSGNHIHAEDFVTPEKTKEEAEDVETGPTVQDIIDADVKKQRDSLDVRKCRLRAERQTLHRLPQSGALVFGFKTYMYPLDEIKREEGMAESLAQAIEGLDSVVPGMNLYKRKVVWGDKVIEYLRTS